MMKLLIGLAAALAASMTMEVATPDTPPSGSNQIAPARDGNIAIREELDAARKARTLAAYDLFIARHPGHPLEAVAREERARLRAHGR